MKVFYHNDLDGRCSAFLILNEYLKREHIKLCESDFYEVDYNTKLDKYLKDVEPMEKIFFVDYSFKENTKYILDNLISKKCDIVWIDHHDSSLKLLEKYDYLGNKSVNGLVSKYRNLSAAALTCLYLNGESEYSEFYEDYIPHYIKLISDYDTWTYRYGEDTTYFKLGMDSISHGPFDTIWQELESISSVLIDVIAKGRCIKSYIDVTNKEYRDSYGYETTLNGIKCFVVNKKSNTWIFGEKYNKYPFVVVWVFNGESYVYSLYSSNSSIDCSKIAEMFGGGGHKGAAGFTSEVLLFKKGQPVLIN